MNEQVELSFSEQTLPTLKLIGRTAVVQSQPEIGPTVGPLFAELAGAFAQAKANPGQFVAWYSWLESGLELGVGVTESLPTSNDFEEQVLAEVPRALVGTYVGPLSRIADAWQALGEEVRRRGGEPVGPCREVYLNTADSAQHEGHEAVEHIQLQQPLA